MIYKKLCVVGVGLFLCGLHPIAGAKVEEKLPFIVNVNHDPQKILSQLSVPIDFTKDADHLTMKQVVKELREALHALGPAAGLAAPQVGHLKRIFLFSWNRDPANLRVAINPSFEPMSEDKELEWEACFSSANEKYPPLHAINMPRYKKIRVTYFNEQGKKESYILEGLAARVFQHEVGHLQGKCTLDFSDVEKKKFNTRAELMAFIMEDRKKHPPVYIKPKPITN